MADEPKDDGAPYVKHMVQYARPYIEDLMRRQRQKVRNKMRQAEQKPVDLQGMALASAQMAVLEDVERQVDRDLRVSER